jgi:hypothetical protein
LSFSKSGSRKAAVLPEPVRAIATTSFPWVMIGIALRWIGVGTCQVGRQAGKQALSGWQRSPRWEAVGGGPRVAGVARGSRWRAAPCSPFA